MGKIRKTNLIFCGIYPNIKDDELVKSLKTLFSVIPVKTGIQSFQWLGRFWIPACAGMTTFYGIVKDDEFVKSQNFPNLVWRKPESSYFKKFWTPAFAGATT